MEIETYGRVMVQVGLPFVMLAPHFVRAIDTGAGKYAEFGDVSKAGPVILLAFASCAFIAILAAIVFCAIDRCCLTPRSRSSSTGGAPDAWRRGGEENSNQSRMARAIGKLSSVRRLTSVENHRARRDLMILFGTSVPTLQEMQAMRSSGIGLGMPPLANVESLYGPYSPTIACSREHVVVCGCK